MNYIDEENCIQEVFGIVDLQLQKINNILIRIQKEFVEYLMDNFDLNESKFNFNKCLSVMIDNSNFEEIEYLRESVEFLQELKNSCNLFLAYKDQQIKDLEIKLVALKQDLLAYEHKKIQKLKIELTNPKQNMLSVLITKDLILKDTNQENCTELQKKIVNSSIHEITTELQKNIMRGKELQKHSGELINWFRAYYAVSF